MRLIPADKLEAKISELLDVFYERRMVSLQGLQLSRTLKRKNPYLFRAIGVSDAGQIVEELLRAHVSSSDETLFGNVFFEPLGLWVATYARAEMEGVSIQTGGGGGCDLTIDTPTSYEAFAIKSGVNVFNSQSKARQVAEFNELRARVSKLRKYFDAVVGYSYGKKNTRGNGKTNFTELAGQEFWNRLTGEKDFYLRILHLMKTKPEEHRINFSDEFDKAKNRFAKEFLIDFSTPDGSIDWNKLACFNSGSDSLNKPTSKAE